MKAADLTDCPLPGAAWLKLLSLSRPVRSVMMMGPVCLPTTTSGSASQQAVTAGFGQQKVAKYEGTTLKKGVGTELSKFLQKLTLRILDSRTCEDSWGQLSGDFRADPDHLFAVSERGDLCLGDKGSGLVVTDCTSDSVELLAVASFTHGQ